MSVTRHVDPTYTWPVAHKGASKAKQGSRCRGKSRDFFFPSQSPMTHGKVSCLSVCQALVSSNISPLSLIYLCLSSILYFSHLLFLYLFSVGLCSQIYLLYLGFLSNILRLFLVISRWDFPSLSYTSPLSIPNLSFTYPLPLIHLSHGSVCSNVFLNYFPFSLFFFTKNGILWQSEPVRLTMTSFHTHFHNCTKNPIW